MTIIIQRITLFGCLIVFVVGNIYYNHGTNNITTISSKNSRSSNSAKKPKTSKRPKTQEAPKNFKKINTSETSEISNESTTFSLYHKPHMNDESCEEDQYLSRLTKIFSKKNFPFGEGFGDKTSNFTTSKIDTVRGIENFNFYEEFSNFLKDSTIKNKNLETFRSYLFRNAWINKPTQYFDPEEKSSLIPNPLRHNRNTCFLVSLIHCIRSNGPLAKFLALPNKNYPNFAKTLKKILEQKRGSVLKKDFYGLVNTKNRANNYKYGQQEDPRLIIDTFLNKCSESWAYMNFSCLSFFHICEEGHINLETKERKLNVSHNYPLLQIPILESEDSFNLQKMLNGIEIDGRCSQCVEGDNKVYEFPLLTNAAPFLIFNLISPTGNDLSHLINDNYKGFSMILQDKIRVPTLFDGVEEYELTGFTEFIRLGNTCGHYIAYIKHEGKWYKCDSDYVNELKIEYPMFIEKQLNNIITQAFFAKSK